jgi:hypothetical protein
MAEKKNKEEAAAASPPPSKHAQLREKRRLLENELSAINGHIQNAITNGNAEAVGKLSARKAELPQLFIAASMAEEVERQEIFSEIDAANLARLEVAEESRNALQQKMAARKAEFEKELKELSDQLMEAEAAVGSALAAVQAPRNVAADAHASFRKSLATLAGV